MRGAVTVPGGLWLAATVMMPLFGWVGLGSAAVAADCGVAIAGVANCVAPGGNPYTTGILYNPVGGLVLNVGTGIIITRDDGPNHNAIRIDGTGALMANLATGVTITASGLDSDGVELYGDGALTINSAANITLAVPTPLVPPGPENGTSGLLAWNSILGTGTGDIAITQAANSTITVTGEDGGGMYGLNYGFGSVLMNSSGTVITDGENGDAVLATNGNTNGKNTTVILGAESVILTKGTWSAGGYSLNYGTGDATVSASGDITTLGEWSYGVLADIDNATSVGNALVVLSDTATIQTGALGGRGGWALTWGLGNASLTSAAKIDTQGARGIGIAADIRNFGSTANTLAHLQGTGSIVTRGELAHGIMSDHWGTGAVVVTMDPGSSVSTAGSLANGVLGTSRGTVTLDQAVSTTITVSGAEAFGVSLAAVDPLLPTLATANVGGAVAATGQFGVGVSSYAGATGLANIAIATNATVGGGWQADIALRGATTDRPSAGVLIGSALSSQLSNLGTISALSDRAIADIGRQTLTAGNLTVGNAGRITGFVELAAGGSNVFNNAALFDVRHFADTNGDGVPDTKRVSISDFGAPTSRFNNAAGATVRLAPVVGEASVDPAGYYVPTTGIDSRPLEASYYALGRAGVVQGQFTNLGSFHHAGLLDLRGSATGNKLVMTGNAAAGGAAGTGVFISDGGQLLLNSVLNEGVAAGGQTGSFSDVLVVDSTQMGTGATTITIDRREGAGAATPGNGILLVEVRNKAASAPGVFVLNGDFVANGAPALIRGAHYYSLLHNGVAGDIADGNWYLRNLGLSPIVPIYEEYPKVLLPLIDLPTLQQRVGNRHWNKAATPRLPQTVFCKDPSQNYQCVVTDAQASYYLDESGTIVSETNGIWGRIEGEIGRYIPPVSTSGARYDTNIWQLQAGLDALLADGEAGTLIAGLTVNYGRSSADITAPGSAGNITSSAYGLGGTLTWYGANGFYADGQAQLTWLDSHLSSLTAGRSLVDGNKGFGYAFSVEAGQRLALGEHWTLTPQAQLTYSSVNFDSFTDPFGTTVALLQGQSLRGRLGLAAEYQSSWKAEDGSVSRVSTYGIANLEKELLDGTRVSVSGFELVSRDNGLWGGLGLGGTYNWNDDKYSIYGEVSANNGLERFGDSVEFGGTVGLRVKW